VQTLRQEYRQFFNDSFKGFRLRAPLFYSWDFGLRFNLQTGDTYNSTRKILDNEGNELPLIGDTSSDEYFIEVNRRASTLFKSVFDSSDRLFLVFMESKYKRKRIKFSNYVFGQITELKKTEFEYFKEYQLYEPGDKSDIYNVALLKLTSDRINYKNIFAAIGNTDFPARQPRLDNNGFLSSKEIYFVNIDKKLIFNMYDDRGLDIIAADKETLRPIYLTFNNWILEHDRKEIDKQFENENAFNI
jgi:hypothetical protein